MINYKSRPKKGVLWWFVLENSWQFKTPFALIVLRQNCEELLSSAQFLKKTDVTVPSVCPQRACLSLCLISVKSDQGKAAECLLILMRLKEERAPARHLFHWDGHK